MKNGCIFFLLSIIISLTVFGALANPSSPETAEYLRVHIRANSNTETDQTLKYGVRDELVDYLTPIVAHCESKAEAVDALRGQIPQMEIIATRYMQREGFAYGARVDIREEEFPTRIYEGYTLPAGAYTSLIVELGAGKGDNWWCVVYPPLCFTATAQNVVYKSKILEIIENWKGGR